MFLYSVSKSKNDYFQFNENSTYTDNQASAALVLFLFKDFSDQDLNPTKVDKVGWSLFSSVFDGINNDRYKSWEVQISRHQCDSKSKLLTQSIM